MAIKITGIDNLLTNLSQVGERAVRGVSDEIKQGAEDIKDLAKLQAPIDEGNLEDAIKVDVDRSGVKGRIQAFVYVDGSVTTDDGKAVEDYAMQMHEGTYNLGPRSQAKDSAVGGGVGRKFLERAVDELSPNIINRVQQAVKRTIR
jgi:HK97 gp10 family phage protein